MKKGVKYKLKMGRPVNHYVASDGEIIPGLTKQTDGRWRIVGTTTKWTEDDEEKAIQKYRRLTGQKSEDDYRPLGKIGLAAVGEMKFTKKVWADYFAKELRTKPEAVARLFGIPELGNLKYLATLKPAESLPKFRELENLWKNSPKHPDYKRKVMSSWVIFKRLAQVSALSEISDKVALKFRDAIRQNGYAPKTQSNIFGHVRAFLTHATNEAIAVEPIAKIVTILQKVLKASGRIKRVNPNPRVLHAFWDPCLHCGRGCLAIHVHSPLSYNRKSWMVGG